MRNPDLYIREVVEVGMPRIAFDRGYCIKRRIDPVAFANLYFPAAFDWRVLLVGTQGTAEYRPGDSPTTPSAVYPTWDYGGDSLTSLEELIVHPVGENRAVCSDVTVPPDERPVFGQEHRVMIVHLPISGSGPGRRIINQLSQLQAEYPEVKLHIHGLYGFLTAFGNGFGAVDIEARTPAAKGKVHLANGKLITHEQSHQWAQWVTLMGMSPVDLEIPRNRCMFNIKSALWAGEYFDKNIKFRTRGSRPDPEGRTLEPAVTTSHRSRRLPLANGDKFACDACSLATTCKYFREGSVCSVPDSEPTELVRLFKTRSADNIVDGLTRVLSLQAERLENGVINEEANDELDPEVTKIANTLLTHGVKLAKLLDPSLNGGPKVGVFVNGAGAQVGIQTNPQAAIASMVSALEAQGIPRDKITEEMVMNLLSGGPGPAAIEAVGASERAR